MKISIKLAIFFNFAPASNNLHPLQVENCDSNSRLALDEDDNGKFRLERVLSSSRFEYLCYGSMAIMNIELF